MIGASRYSGQSVMFGSDFVHNSGIIIRIGHAELKRDLYHDWYFKKDEIVEVRLTEAQWATFVSSLNAGDGVPCTLAYLGRKQIPELPKPASRIEQFEGEVSNKLKDCLQQLQDLENTINGLGLSKKKASELLEIVTSVHMQLKCNLPFAAKSFSEHAERTVEKAKTEVHGYMMNTLQRVGLAALKGEKPPLELGGDHGKNEGKGDGQTEN